MDAFLLTTQSSSCL